MTEWNKTVRILFFKNTSAMEVRKDIKKLCEDFKQLNPKFKFKAPYIGIYLDQFSQELYLELKHFQKIQEDKINNCSVQKDVRLWYVSIYC